MRTLGTILALTLVASPAIASKNQELDKAFVAYKEGKVIILDKKTTTPASLSDLLKLKSHSIPQALYVLGKSKSTLNTSDLSNLRKLEEIHRQRTHKVKYGDQWRFIKAKDYEQMLCNEIERIITRLEKKSRE